MPATVRIAVKPRILEKHVQEGVTQLLELDGWRSLRTDPVSNRGRGTGFGELGMPDYLYLRYNEGGYNTGEIMWIEFKAPGKKPQLHQKEWIVLEVERGALVKIVDNFDEFRTWYVKQSGLNRRIAV